MNLTRFLLVIFLSIHSITNAQHKINGVSLVGTRQMISQKNMTPIKSLNANWVTVMPFAFIRKGNPTVLFDKNFQWVGEKPVGIIETIKISKKNNLKIMLKPHIWMIHGGWIGGLNYTNEKDWKRFEESYSDYIISFAKIADSLEVEIFCIGVEIKNAVVRRPLFFKSLIKKVRAIYSGKITYAANWDNYKNVIFWNDLDYIGIDAYFPISELKTPSFQSCFIGWKTHFNAIKQFSLTQDKKVIFTEFGYRNIDYTGKEPWNEAQETSFNSIAQENAYKAIFASFWKEPWFIGGFLWKWFPNHEATGGTKDNRFTPQNKPVEKIISNFYNYTK